MGGCLKASSQRHVDDLQCKHFCQRSSVSTVVPRDNVCLVTCRLKQQALQQLTKVLGHQNPMWCHVQSIKPLSFFIIYIILCEGMGCWAAGSSALLLVFALIWPWTIDRDGIHSCVQNAMGTEEIQVGNSTIEWMVEARFTTTTGAAQEQLATAKCSSQFQLQRLQRSKVIPCHPLMASFILPSLALASGSWWNNVWNTTASVHRCSHRGPDSSHKALVYEELHDVVEPRRSKLRPPGSAPLALLLYLGHVHSILPKTLIVIHHCPSGSSMWPGCESASGSVADNDCWDEAASCKWWRHLSNRSLQGVSPRKVIKYHKDS